MPPSHRPTTSTASSPHFRPFRAGPNTEALRAAQGSSPRPLATCILLRVHQALTRRTAGLAPGTSVRCARLAFYAPRVERRVVALQAGPQCACAAAGAVGGCACRRVQSGTGGRLRQDVRDRPSAAIGRAPRQPRGGGTRLRIERSTGDRAIGLGGPGREAGHRQRPDERGAVPSQAVPHEQSQGTCGAVGVGQPHRWRAVRQRRAVRGIRPPRSVR